jgi:hypothetical protein
MHADGKLQEGQGAGLILFVENSLFSLFIHCLALATLDNFRKKSPFICCCFEVSTFTRQLLTTE